MAPSELDEYVDRVRRIFAALPDGAIEAAERSPPADDLTEGLLRENDAWASQVSLPVAQQFISGGLHYEAQTPAAEHDLEGLMRSVAHWSSDVYVRTEAPARKRAGSLGAHVDPGTSPDVPRSSCSSLRPLGPTLRNTYGIEP